MKQDRRRNGIKRTFWIMVDDQIAMKHEETFFIGLDGLGLGRTTAGSWVVSDAWLTIIMKQ
jgi:hypothetical protein